MKRFIAALFSLSVTHAATANLSADLISIDSIRVKENGDFIIKPAVCHSGPCNCSDYWADEAYGLDINGKEMQMSLLLAAQMATSKVYIYYNNVDGQCRQQQVQITNG